MNKFISYIFIFSTFIALAQAPGHLGKRFVLGYGAHFSPAITNGNAHNKTIIGHLEREVGSAETGSFAFNYTHEAYMEVALSTRFMLGFSGKFYKTTYDNAQSIDDYYNYNNHYRIDKNVEGYYSIKGTSLCLYGKLYSKRYVAPWGRYIIFGPVINLYRTSYDSTIMFQTLTDSYTYDISKFSKFGELNQSFTGFNIVYGWGRSRIIAKRVILDYGISMQLFSVMSLFTEQILSSRFSKTVTSDNYIEKTSGIRIRGLNRFNAFVKVGFLIF